MAKQNSPREVILKDARARILQEKVQRAKTHLSRLMPAATITYTGEVGADSRNYRVNFDLLKQVLPNFKLQYTLASGMETVALSLTLPAEKNA